MAVGNEHLVGPEDDNFHPPTEDSRWWHETCWFWFFVPERKLGGWLYNWIRPNIGVTGGGCWIWDDSTFFHMEVPYYACYSNLPLPEERDLRDFAFPSGTSVKMLEPLRRYRLRHSDRDWIHLDLEYEAIMEPWVAAQGDPPRARHIDQVGRVTGELVLHGDRMAVDCLAMRDRTWSPRSERWKDGGAYGYTNAAASADLSFHFSGTDQGGSGYLVRDGVRAGLASGKRTVERDSQHGFVTRIRVEGTDTEGRALEALGESVSRMAMPIPGVHAVVWTSLIQWTVNGTPAWGEDQEPWPLNRWSEFRRQQR